MQYLLLGISGEGFSERTEDENEPQNIVVCIIMHCMGLCPPPSHHFSALLLLAISLPYSSFLPSCPLSLCTLRICPLSTSTKINHDKCHGSCFAHFTFLIIIISSHVHHYFVVSFCPGGRVRCVSEGDMKWIAKTNHDKCRGLCFGTHHWGIPLHGSL